MQCDVAVIAKLLKLLVVYILMCFSGHLELEYCYWTWVGQRNSMTFIHFC